MVSIYFCRVSVKGIEHRPTTLERHLQTTQYNPCQETALAAPTLWKEYGTSNQMKCTSRTNLAPLNTLICQWIAFQSLCRPTDAAVCNLVADTAVFITD